MLCNAPSIISQYLPALLPQHALLLSVAPNFPIAYSCPTRCSCSVKLLPVLSLSWHGSSTRTSLPSLYKEGAYLLQFNLLLVLCTSFSAKRTCQDMLLTYRHEGEACNCNNRTTWSTGQSKVSATSAMHFSLLFKQSRLA